MEKILRKKKVVTKKKFQLHIYLMYREVEHFLNLNK